MRVGGRRVTAALPLAGAMALLVFCLAGSRLYVSSAGSAAFAQAYATTCRSASALRLPVPHDAEYGADQAARVLVHVDPPIRQYRAQAQLLASWGTRRLTMISVDGAAANLASPLRPLGLDEVAVTRTSLEQLGAEVGDTFDTREGPRLTIAQVVDDVPTTPVPDFWCGFADLLQPTAIGEPPPPWFLAAEETLLEFGGQRTDEYRITTSSLTLADADEAVRAYAVATAAWQARFATTFGLLRANELPRLAARAHAVATTVDRSVTPLLVTAATAVTCVLGAMAVLLARSRARELRLLAIRGLAPWRIALAVAPAATLALAAGAVVGGMAAWSAVRALGPSPALESAAVAASMLRGAAALVLAVPLVVGVVGLVADRWADRPARARRRRWALAASAAVPVGLAWVSFRELDRHGGIRTTGVTSRGGALLPMGFPLFTLAAAATVVALVLAAVVPRSRLTGARLGRALRLGWRRAVLDTGPAVAVVAAVVLAAGCYTTSRSLANASAQELSDKAATYVGADLAVTVYDDPRVPAAWADRTAAVLTAHGRDAQGAAWDLAGVPRDRFAAVAARPRVSQAKLEEDMAAIAPAGADEPQPAIAVGGGGGDAVPHVGDVVVIRPAGARRELVLRIVAVRATYPMANNGAVVYVLDRDAVADVVPFPTTVLLVRDPPVDAAQQLRDLGVRTGTALAATSVFDGAAYSGVRWSYAPLGVLGVLFGVVALTVQLLVAAGRAPTRRAAHVVMRRSGFRPHQLLGATVVELGVPVLVGVVLGTTAAAVAVRLAVGRLDPMPQLRPAPVAALPWGSTGAVVVAAAAWTLLVAAAVTRSILRADPVEVLHGEL